jgi:hypothetical protein
MEGTLYFFPRLHLPSRAIKADIFYAHRLPIRRPRLRVPLGLSLTTLGHV